MAPSLSPRILQLPTGQLRKYFTARSRVILRSWPVLGYSRNSPEFYETWKFITASTSARHLSLSWASSIQSLSPTNPIPV